MDFDLISDLYLDQWSDKINFRGLGTSLTCVVAGNVSSSPIITRDFLFMLADSYSYVIFVDGDAEHKGAYDYIDDTCSWFEKELSRKPNITYLWDSTCVIGKTAFVGSNGWWTFDYSSSITKIEHIEAFCELEAQASSTAINIWDQAVENSEFLSEICQHLDTSPIVDQIVLVTHTLPRNDLIDTKLELTEMSKMYNSTMKDVINKVPSGKLKTWCFGHYHFQSIDKSIDHIRYVSNPRGLPKNNSCLIYYPKLIKL